jgi:hypothetical protein
MGGRQNGGEGQWRIKVLGALEESFDGGPPSISNQKIKKHTFTYNIKNQAANLKFKFYYLQISI